MRPSTIFILTVAILLGVAAAIAGRMSGLFGRLEQPAAKKPETQVLVAAKPLFAGDVMDPNSVRLRPLRPDEIAEFDRHKEKYVPAVREAVALRIAKKTLETDTPILKEHLEELTKPEPLNERLLPQMRAVNVSVPKDQSVGGLIQPGEWVDVLLTSDIEMADGSKFTRTAVVANKVRVIAKRNVLWSVFAPLPDDKPVHFTLEMNPYRAALIEDVKKKGLITLTPLPASEQKALEKKRLQIMEKPDQMMMVAWDETDGDELKAEQERVASYGRGDLVVGDGDLTRIFDIRQPVTAPAVKNIMIEQFYGHDRKEIGEFSPVTGQPVTDDKCKTCTSSGRAATVKSMQFRSPDAGYPAVKKAASKG